MAFSLMYLKKLPILLLLSLIILFSLSCYAQTVSDELLKAAKSQQWEKVKELLSQGANINSQDENGNTIIMLAARQGNASICEYLYQRVADVSLTNLQGKTVFEIGEEVNNQEVKFFFSSIRYFQTYELIQASKAGDFDRVKKALDNGAIINEPDLEGKTALHHTVVKATLSHGSLEVSKLLLNYGADVNTQTNLRITPLMVASLSGNVQMCQLLISYKADLEIKNMKGETAYDIAKKLEKKLAASYLQDTTTDISGTPWKFLNDSSEFYLDKGKYDKSLQLAKKALERAQIEFTETNEYYLRSLTTLAKVNDKMLRYEEAEILYKKVFGMAEKLKVENPNYYRTCLGNLAAFYIKLVRYEEAVNLLEHVVNEEEVAQEKNHNNYGHFLISLADIYMIMNRYEEAESLYVKVLQLTDNEEYADKLTKSLNNLADLYVKLYRYEEAEAFYKKALQVTESTGTFVGVLSVLTYSQYGKILGELANLYVKLNRYEEAEVFYKKAIQVTAGYKAFDEILPKRIEGRDPFVTAGLRIYGVTSNQLGVLFHEKNRYEEAETLYKEALNIFKKAYGKYHSNYRASLDNLAALYRSKSQFDLAEQFYLQSNEIILHNLKQGFIGLSEIEQKKYLEDIDDNFEKYYSFILKRKVDNPFITILSYDNILITKGLLLQSSLNLKYAIENSGDSTLLTTFEKWKKIKSLEVELQTLPHDQHLYIVDSISKKANHLEKELSRRAPFFQEQKRALATTWNDVKQHLSANEAAVEFVQFRYHNGRGFSESIQYAALVLRPEDGYPHMIELFKEKTLQQYLYHNVATKNDDGYLNRVYKKAGKELYSLIWQPLDSLLKDTNTIYFSPSGLLNKIALDALPINIDSTMADRYHMNQLLSTRSVVTKYQDNPHPKTAALFGGINYDTDLATLSKIKAQYHQDPRFLNQSYFPTQSENNLTFDYIQGSLNEVDSIQKYMLECGMEASLIKGDSAIEESVKSLDGKKAPDILHISTHGIYTEDTLKQRDDFFTLTQRDYQPFRDPMNHIGLVMAGANRLSIDKGGKINMGDGILTANEVSLMNLMNTELVVLSACDTGLGDIDDSEGVYGLQRAFKKAGVKYVMMSLGKVGARVSQKFMEKFYRNLLKEGMSVRVSFEQARQEMRQDYPDKPERWAPFVLVE